jgi:CubicO group peptidase (beta-lactamase class C family)
MKKGLFLLIVFAILVSACGSPTRSSSTLSEKSTVIDAIIDTAVTQIPLASLTVGIRYGKQPLYFHSAGFANLETIQPSTPKTMYEIGSITKQFTAVGIMQLVEQGKLSLDDPVTSILPDLPSLMNAMQVHHLLNHTSGLPVTTYMGIQENDNRLYTPTEILSVYTSQLKQLDAEPGQEFRYNNDGYFILGVILEKISGQMYEQYLQQHIFKPAGLTETSVCTPDMQKQTIGYRLSVQLFLPLPPVNETLNYAAGGLCSTASDLLKWQQALWGGLIVRQDSLKQMTTPGRLKDGTLLQYGFGLQLGKAKGQQLIYHNGVVGGFYSRLEYYPAADLALVLLTNSQPGSTLGLQELSQKIAGELMPAVKKSQQ